MPNPAASPRPKRAPAAKPAQAATQATTQAARTATTDKHRRAAELLRELRLSAEKLSANADRLLSRVAR